MEQIKSVDPFSDDFCNFVGLSKRWWGARMQRSAKWIELTTTMRVIEKLIKEIYFAIQSQLINLRWLKISLTWKLDKQVYALCIYLQSYCFIRFSIFSTSDCNIDSMRWRYQWYMIYDWWGGCCWLVTCTHSALCFPLLDKIMGDKIEMAGGGRDWLFTVQLYSPHTIISPS